MTYSIYDAWWVDVADYDGDGYRHDGNLKVDVDVSSGTHSIYLFLHIKPSSSSSWQLWEKTDCFSITGNNSGDTYTFIHPFSNDIIHGTYDFRVKVCECGSSTIKATRGPGHDADLDDEKLETAQEDWIKLTTTATADAYVSDIQPNTNFGSENNVLVMVDVDTDIRAFVKFNISSIPAGSDVKLALLNLNLTGGSGSSYFALARSYWSETTITYNNKPYDDLPCLSPTIPASPGIWSIDVTDIVEEWVEGNHTNYGFFIAGYWFVFLSKESGYNPALFVYYTP